jgi:malate synthase
MAAFIPSRRDADVNARAFAKVREDKERESGAGFDGTWVAHPDLVPVARAAFDHVLGQRPHQKSVLREDVQSAAGELIDATVPGGLVTDSGVRTNVDVALRYLDSWLRGNGAAAIHNLMEDAATAEISRSQLWQWIRHGAEIDGGGEMTREYYQRVRMQALDALEREEPPTSRFAEAAAVLDTLVLGEWENFLTTVAMPMLEADDANS